MALLALLCAAGTEPRNASHALARSALPSRQLAGDRRRLSDQYAQIAKLTAADAAAGDEFGYSVAIDGDTVVIGAYSKEAAYVFRTTDGGATYGQVAKLTASDAAADDLFG